ncbi:YhbD family protein [Alicyclobacillus fastidiosus]|uniref:YhbD family protein n=1 Tax=Alicyclobacillus fastidiosus TaxID=392011 RepID=A0ABV5ADL0_9BACL|nr:YhbD family protein [Alicyclobacillus fastidiosus]WEH08613.1 YhbD family protein [Alicyclobacillus fastidiosus]
MDQDLMSKKELLDLTGISYGQLYRWKRKNLIPEDWFIRKSTFTGQETFFPKERMLQRIEQIKNMKDGLSLDEMANMFSPSPSNVSFTREQLVSQNIVTEMALEVFLSRHPDKQVFPFADLLAIYLVDIALKTGDIHLDEGGIILETMEESYSRFEDGKCRLVFVRKLGVSLCILCSTADDVIFDSATRVVFEFDVTKCVEDLKLKLV